MQVIVNMLDFGMDPQQALEACRFCIQSGEHTGVICIEDGVDAETIAALRRMGHPLKVVFRIS